MCMSWADTLVRPYCIILTLDRGPGTC